MFKQVDIRERLQFAIPLWWQDIKEMKNIHDRSSEELKRYADDYYRYVDSRSPLTADECGILKWEIFYGITPNIHKALVDRRAVVVSKMRGVGTVTQARVKFAAESFEFGEVSVSESNGTVQITFLSERGVPRHLNDIQKALRNLIPAHLALTFRFTYLTWEEHDKKAQTWAQLNDANQTWSEFERA